MILNDDSTIVSYKLKDMKMIFTLNESNEIVEITLKIIVQNAK